MEPKEIADSFLKWIQENYKAQKTKLQSFCFNQHFTWSEDIFENSILSVFEKIAKTGLKDPTPDGFDKYFFLAFKFNTLRETAYCRVKKRQYIDNLETTYERFSNETKITEIQKIFNDLKVDFYTSYLISKLESAGEIDEIAIYCFKIKHLMPNMTYRKLTQITGLKDARSKVLKCRDYLRANTNKREMEEAFERFLEENDIFLTE